jgi:hypothetical protein
MSDDTPSPDALTETSKDDIKLTEADLNQVSGGWKTAPEPESKQGPSDKY